ncbi:MAG: nitroreductase [Betaproteobacteria bacterium]|nr:nitroreductase [Betaproteobacteria bacterium]
MTGNATVLTQLLRQRRSVRDFRPDPVPDEVLEAILADACQSPSWSNTQPYRLAVASGELRNRLATEYCAAWDASLAALKSGAIGKLRLALGAEGRPDGDFNTRFPYPADLLPRRRATGFGLYKALGIAREDMAARNRQMRRNFEFFGAPTVIFLFVHRGLREFSVLDAGILLQSLMMSAQARGLATCAQGALANWAGPPKRAFAVPPDYKLICGISLGYASTSGVNQFNPGRSPAAELLLAPR